MRKVDSASARLMPIARSTCDGSNAPELQADPLPMHTVGKLAINMSAGIPGIVRLMVPGNLFAFDELTLDSGIVAKRADSSVSRSCVIRCASD